MAHKQRGSCRWYPSTRHEVIFDRFRAQLGCWSRTGAVPGCADPDTREALRAQQQRLARLGLRMDLDVEPEPEDPVLPLHTAVSSIPVADGALCRFNRVSYVQQVTRRAQFFRGSRCIHHRRSGLALHQTITDPEPGETRMGQTPYVCPDCGTISTAAQLQAEGCPHCQSRIPPGELYPQVSGFHWRESLGLSQRQFHKLLRAAGIGGGLVALAGSLVNLFATEADYPLVIALGSLLLYWPLFFVMLYLLCCMGLLVGLLVRFGCSLRLMGTIHTPVKIRRLLSPFDPALDFYYLEGKALALARSILFSEDPASCPAYQGPELGSLFDDVIDLEYRGALALDRAGQVEDRLELSLRLYLTLTHYDGQRARVRHQVLHMELAHRLQYPVEPGYSPLKARCLGCGSCFDARRVRFCPCCGRAYDVAEDDWVVTRLSL